MRMIGLWKVLMLVGLALASLQCNAQWGPVSAHVTLIDPSAMGSRAGDSTVPIIFNIDTAISGNPCGVTGSNPANLLWVPVNFVNGTGDTSHPTGDDRQMVNSRAMLSTLQIALATGVQVKLWGYSGSGGYCQVYEIQLLSS